MDHEKALLDFVLAPNAFQALEAVLRPRIEDVLRTDAEKFGERTGLVYRGASDFLLQHGVWFTKVANVPPQQRLLEGYCYGAAIQGCVQIGEKYFEGVALDPIANALFAHAWNVSPKRPDTVIDRTRVNSPCLIYVGVEFSVERADDCTWNGDACVLQDEKRGYPLFQQRWHGEDYSIQWPYSERLEIFRSRDMEWFLKWQAENKHYCK